MQSNTTKVVLVGIVGVVLFFIVSQIVACVAAGSLFNSFFNKQAEQHMCPGNCQTEPPNSNFPEEW